jgi:hypothetical protein
MSGELGIGVFPPKGQSLRQEHEEPLTYLKRIIPTLGNVIPVSGIIREQKRNLGSIRYDGAAA